MVQTIKDIDYLPQAGLNSLLTRHAYGSGAFAHNDDSASTALLAAPAAAAGLISGPNSVQLEDTSLADNVANNYVHFYQILQKLRTNNFTTSDSIVLNVLSDKCPLTDGAIVYQARALRRFVTNELVVYNGDCAEYGNNARLIKESSEQAYQLIPNPNRGQFELIQLVQNNAPIQVTVCDVLGRTIYKNRIVFNGKKAKIDIGNTVPGFYYLTIGDNKPKICSRIIL